ncbi:MAG TPA: hypothetical protein PKW66_10035, partial [Polyangiaceae bacterium]|nr:hypothetical protein [Polyangiaceae bacterium]
PAYLDIPLDQNWRLSLLLVSLATSIIVGSVCVPIVAKAIRPGKLIAFGAVAMLVCQASLTVSISAWGPQAYSTCVVLVAILGFTGAFFAVPVQTFLQDAPEQGTRGITFAVNNFLNFSFIFLAGAFYLTSAKIQLSPGFAATLAAVAMCSVLWVVRKSVLGIERPNATSTP